MENKQTILKIGKLTVKTGEYEKDGVKKNQYLNFGTIFTNPNNGNISLKIDCIPTIGWNSWVNVFLEEGYKIEVIKKEIEPEEDNPF